MKQYVDSVNLGDGPTACRYIVSFLQDSALTWWRSYAMSHHDVFSNLTVDVLLSELSEQFSDVDREMKIRNKLFAIK